MGKSKEEKMAEKSARQEKMNRQARAFGVKVGKSIHLAEHVARAQRVVDRHPVRSAFALVAVVAFISVTGIMSDFAFRTDESPMDDLRGMEQMSANIRLINSIDDGRREQRMMLNTIGEAAFDLKAEYDSLLALESMTHEDSVELQSVAARLNYIINEMKGLNHKTIKP